MANVAQGKRNLNVNLLAETIERIERLKVLTMRSNVGDVIDAAVANMLQHEESKAAAAVVPTSASSNGGE